MRPHRVTCWISLAIAGMSALLALGVLGVWVRSYWYLDAVDGVSIDNNCAWTIQASNGLVELIFSYEPEPPKYGILWGFGSWPGGRLQFAGSGGTMIERLGFRYMRAGPLRPPNWLTIINFPHWFVFVLLAAYPSWFVRKSMRRRKRVKGGHCVGCGYDLRGSAERCPECGRQVPAPLTSESANTAP